MDRPRRSARQSTSGHSPAPTSAMTSSPNAAPSSTILPAQMANGISNSRRYEAATHASVAPYPQQSAQRPQFCQTASASGSSVLQATSHQQRVQPPRPLFNTSMVPSEPLRVNQMTLQALPPVHLMGRGTAPLAPATPSAPLRSSGTAASGPTLPQAMYSTFPARIKAGTTNLLQSMPSSEWYDGSGKPLDLLSTPAYDASSANSYRNSRSSGRSRRAATGFIRYAEAGSSDDEFEEDVGTEDEARGVKRGLEHEEDEESSRAYLGLPPPASKMIAKRVFHRTNHVYHNDDELARQAGRNEILVPIKIDLEAEQYRIKDSFTWNMNERLVSPHHFARLLLEDLDIPVEPYATQIMNMINQQIDDATGVADIEMEPAAGSVWASARISGKEGELSLPVSERIQYDPEEEATKEGRSWNWGLEREDEEQRQWRTRMAKRLDAGQGLGDFEDDLRVIVDYEVQILRHMLRDRLEWDLCSPLTPENFARKLCDDLGLSGEAQPLIANSVREQLINHKRAALELQLVGSGRVLKEKEREIEIAWAELHAEKVDKQRKRLEKGDSESANVTVVNTPREASEQPTGDEAVQLEPKAGNGEANPDGTMEVNTPRDDDEEDVETLHLTATATAVPTREGTSTPAPLATRSSARLSEAQLTATPSDTQTPSQRLHNATYTVREILSRGPRPLDGIWRDWFESREFGPLLEKLNDDDLEKLEEANVRASRRNRREAARAGGRRRR